MPALPAAPSCHGRNRLIMMAVIANAQAHRYQRQPVRTLRAHRALPAVRAFANTTPTTPTTHAVIAARKIVSSIDLGGS